MPTKPVPEVFDRWRSLYDELTPGAQVLVYEFISLIWPGQWHCNLPAVTEFLQHTQPASIIEFGGYNGELARVMFKQKVVDCPWTNCEIAPIPSICDNPHYNVVTKMQQAEALISSHSFEHIREAEVREALKRADARHLFIDCPLPPTETPTWEGYEGTHILELSWAELDARIRELGYKAWETWSTSISHARAYTKED